MNIRMKVILLLALALVSVLLITSCGEEPPYDEYDENGYSVSVKYDANGGILTDGVPVIIDTYSLDDLPDKNGMKVIQLTDPEDIAVRGDVNKFVPDKSGYTFTGWYAERTEVTDKDGNVTYKYSKKWDFKNDRLRVDPDEDYEASEPVLTLYAGWVPNVTFEFYSLNSPSTLIGKVENISAGGSIAVPAWNATLKSMYMGNFPEVGENKTYIAAYTDAQGINQITGTTVKHTGVVNYENATIDNPVMKIYIEAWDGKWNYVYSHEDLMSYTTADGLEMSGIDPEGNYVIMNDIDFLASSILGMNDYYEWSMANVTGVFNGKIVGVVKANGERVKIKNVNFAQSYFSPPNYNGMFGEIGSRAVLENIDFENITMTIDQGSWGMTVGYGLLAGSIDANATIENVSVTGTMKISTACTFNSAGRIMIGLICGAGDNHGIDYSGVKVEQLGEKPGFKIEVIKDSVYVTIP